MRRDYTLRKNIIDLLGYCPKYLFFAVTYFVLNTIIKKLVLLIRKNRLKIFSTFFVLGGIFYLEFDPYFWMLYVLFITLTIFLFSVIPIAGNILCFTTLGAYAAVFAIDHYSGSNLKYIVINAIRRATVPNFNVAVIEPPYQGEGKNCT